MAGDLTQFNVSPSTREVAKVSAPSVQSAVPEQLQQMGGAISQTGGVAAKLFADHLHEVNRLRVDDAATKLTRAAMEHSTGPNGYLTLRGEDAVNRPDGKTLADEYGEALDKDADGIGATLTKTQREAFQAIATDYSTRFRQQADQHAFKQTEVWQAQVYETRNTAQSEVIATNPLNQERIDAARQNMENNLRQRMDKLGVSGDDAFNNEMVRLMTPGLKNGFQRLVDSDMIEEAQAFYDKNSRYMDGDAQTSVNRVLTAAEDQRAAKAAAADAHAGLTANSGPQGASGSGSPVKGAAWKITSEIGDSRDGGARSHAGVDFQPPAAHPGWYPTQDFTISNVHTQARGGAGGIIADITFANGKKIRAMHLAEAPREGSYKAGTLAAVAGKTGNAKGNKGAIIHAEGLNPDGSRFDPRAYFPVGSAGGSSNAARASGGAEPGSVASLQQGIASIQDNAALSPRAKDLAIAMFKQDFSLMAAVKQEAEEKAVDSAYNKVYRSGGDMGALSPTEIAGLGRSIGPILGFAESIKARRDAGRSVPDSEFLPVYGAVMQEIIAGRITKPEQLARYAPTLGRVETKRFMDMIVAGQKGDRSKMDSTKSTIDALEDGKKLGWVPKALLEKGKEDEYNAFAARVERQIQRQEAASGKPATPEERRKAVLGQSSISSVRDAQGNPMTGAQLQDAYEGIPRDIREKLAGQLRARRLPVTQGNIVNAANQAMQAYGAGQ